jgi:hypothetical protein
MIKNIQFEIIKNFKEYDYLISLNNLIIIIKELPYLYKNAIIEHYCLSFE